MRTDTAKKIIKYIDIQKEVTPHQLRDHLGIGSPALFRQLKKLVERGAIAKTGTPPRVFYFSALNKGKTDHDIATAVGDFWSLPGSLASSISLTDEDLRQARKQFTSQWPRLELKPQKK